MTDDAHLSDSALPDAGTDAGADAGAEAGAVDAAGVRAPASTGRRLTAALFATALLVVLVDQLSKAWAVAALTGTGRVPIVAGWFWFDLVRNSGAAFSFATGQTWVFTVIATVAVLAIVRIARRVASSWWAAALGLLLGGAAGNLIDRLVREPGFGRGHVIDFLEWPNFPVFNVADSCIVASAVLIGILGIRGIGLEDSRAVPDAKGAE